MNKNVIIFSIILLVLTSIYKMEHEATKPQPVKMALLSLAKLDEIEATSHDKLYGGPDNMYSKRVDKVLKLSISKEQRLPNSIDDFINLQSLTLISCNQMDLEKELSKIKYPKRLQELIILVNENESYTFPDVILSMTELKSLTIAGTKISTIPKEIKAISKLERLSLGHPFCGGNEISDIKPITQLKKIKELRLWGSTIDFNEDFYKMNQLETLDLSYTNHTDQQKLFSTFTNLKSLNITGLEYQDLEGITQLKALENLEIRYSNSLKSLGDDFEKLEQLKSLNLYVRKEYFNTDTFNKIAKFPRLTQLNLEVNKDCTGDFPLPDQGFKRITALRIDGNHGNGTSYEVEMFPIITSIDTLKRLQITKVEDKAITPSWLDLSNLKELKLANLSFYSLPDGFYVPRLESLDIDDVPIQKLPKTLNPLKGLKSLSIKDTGISPQDSVLRQLNVARAIE